MFSLTVFSTVVYKVFTVLPKIQLYVLLFTLLSSTSTPSPAQARPCFVGSCFKIVIWVRSLTVASLVGVPMLFALSAKRVSLSPTNISLLYHGKMCCPNKAVTSVYLCLGISTSRCSSLSLFVAVTRSCTLEFSQEAESTNQTPFFILD